jgi:hypothetical protein
MEKIKAVRIMCDWYADGVWSVPGYGSMADFRVSPELWARIQAWQDWYHQHDPSAFPDPNFDVEAFTIEGLQIAVAVKTELPDWTVVYSDEAADYYWLNNGVSRVWMTHQYEITTRLH